MTAVSAPSPFPDAGRRAVFAELADALVPAAHGMPSAATVVDDARVAFVLAARPDLAAPLWDALRPGLGDGAAERLAQLADAPDLLATVQLVVVAGYYTDAGVRAAIGYPGQVAKPVTALDYPAYVAEGLVDAVVARGPIWRDPDAPTDRSAQTDEGEPR